VHTLSATISKQLTADCEQCFGLCCVALPFAKSTDFPFDKDGGSPCRNLQSNYQCSIHSELRKKGFRGCTAYECFGAGQKVSQITYQGIDWRKDPIQAKEMFNVFPIMQQLHEMLWYLKDALNLEASKPLHNKLLDRFEETTHYTEQSPEFILNMDITQHRSKVNSLLLQTSELVREKYLTKKFKVRISRDLVGARLRGADLLGANLRGALLIATDLREADLRMTDLIGADFRDTDISGANLSGCIFLTQAQVNAAKGNSKTKLPSSLKIPAHWEQSM